MSRELKALWTRLGIPADYARMRKMPVQRGAARLVSVGPAPDDGQPVRLTPRAAAAWKKMRVAASADGVTLLPLSGYRSVARQTRIIRKKLRGGSAISDILRLVAAPGCSEHQTGRAIDVGSPAHQQLDEDFAKTAEFRWLKKRAARFGFCLSYPRKNRHGIGYEPWHWCWRC